MDVLVWVMTGIAIWHFAVLVPDRFWGGIIGALLSGIIGAVVVGLLVALVTGSGINDPDIATMIESAIGGALGLAACYAIGRSRGAEPIPDMQE